MEELEMLLTKLKVRSVLCLLALFVSVGTMRAAGPWYVDATNGNDGNTCLAPGTGNACQTIGAAILLASSGDTINVAAGTYNELVVISKTITLLGAQHGVDARTRTVPPTSESMVGSGDGAFQIEADSVVIDGFTIQGVTN